ncbi:Rz1-like lysis system protein LysC [Pragia fontium]|uniref:Rz1-like lysis system protein LysC n=2 Tax=Pragia fontium TaxID=82985 RepID=UPI003D12B671
MLSLSGCANESPRSTPPLPVPKMLFRPCQAPDYQVRYYGDYPGYVAELLAVIERCNGQLEGVRKVVESYTSFDNEILSPNNNKNKEKQLKVK